MKKKLNITLIFGGRSAEHEVSLRSAAAVYSNLNNKKFNISSIFINKTGQWKNVESPLFPSRDLNQGRFSSFLPWDKSSQTEKIKSDVYFPVLHGPFGEDGTIQGFFEIADVPYVGAAVLASAVGMDKAMTKSICRAKGLPVVRYQVIMEENRKGQKEGILENIKKGFQMPFYIKPANMGSSVGITKVYHTGKIEYALEKAFRHDRKILIEEGISGRELECSVLGNENPRASLPGEIIPFRDYYDYKDKYIEGKTSFKIPAKLPQDIIQEIQSLAVKAFKAIDCSGMARVDFFLQEKSKKIFFSEINTIPGFTEISMYPKLWEVSGLAFPDLLEKLIRLALKKHGQRKRNIHPK